LEDLENGKLIASYDVQFYENDSSSELAHVDTGIIHSTTEEIDKFVDSALYPEGNEPRQILIPSPSNTEVMTEEDESEYNSAAEQTPIRDLQYPTPPRPSTPKRSPAEAIIPSAPRKSEKWDDLPKRTLPTRERCLPVRY
ncbi:hypothetical protein C0993_001813, partial [Termitomyces sp. T159_Od127]